MHIVSAKFIKGIIGTDDILYDGKFQVVFLGRSNVGKSTLINSLTQKDGLARSSSNPGKTIRMDFFLVNDALYFVDFPGYGYARHSPEKREKLAKMILWYLLYSEVKDRLAILVIDTKVGITEYDKDIIQTLQKEHIDHIIVANKIDNVPMNEKEKQLSLIREAYAPSEVIPYSSKKRYGRDALMARIFSYLAKSQSKKG